MDTNFTYLTTELFFGFIALLFLTKILGKTQISQLTPFDFISALVLGELVGNAIYDKNIGLNYVLYAVFFWGTLIAVVEAITQKWKKSRGILEGKPSIVIKRGIVDREQLKKNKLDLNQLQNLLRNKNVFSINEVEYAILEANGTVNVLKRSPFQTVEKRDFTTTFSPAVLPVSVILDGEWVEDNISETPFTKKQLEEALLLKGLRAEHVLYGEWSYENQLYIQTAHSPYIKYIDI
ncbi:DUF421 domain-containing protein [Evansella clarkii]|uniref:DUF421 domain-containing protein n=1 Tax=Evansella clarkii TaxID=79879 RepID=UPI000B44E008|nr:DUF421 domain-containing protein [Evansella clarkii]